MPYRSEEHVYPLVVQDDGRPLRNVDTVQELADILVADAADALDGGGCTRGQAVRDDSTGPDYAPDWETLSMSFPRRTSSSFWVFDSSMVTPSSMFTCRTV